MRVPGARVLVGSLALIAALGTVGWLDYRATTNELRAALEGEADALHATIAAAARVQHAAAEAAERALGQRLWEHGRMLAAIDRLHGLDRAALDSVAAAADVFRVVVFEADGTRTYIGGDTTTGGGGSGGGAGRGGAAGLGLGLGPRAGRGGEGVGARAGAGPPAGVSRVAQRLLSGEEQEVVSAAHSSRDGSERVAAGVRRAGGGAIVLNATNSLGRELDAVYSLDALVTRISASTPAIGYIVIADPTDRVARGPLATSADDPAVRARVLERSGTIPLADTQTTELRVGMRLDEVARAERRALIRIAGGLSASAALIVVAIAFGLLQQRYGDLHARHARAQESLRRRDRLAAMGELASTVAHEIRNPLNAIAMSAQRLAREYPVTDAAKQDAGELVDVIQSEASRINGTVQQFLEFARPPALNVRETSLDVLVHEIAQAAAAYAAARDVRVVTDVDAGAQIDADPDQLRHAIDNLLRNAVEASPSGTSVTVRARVRGGAALIEVEDVGAGIPPDVLPKVFDLYFTTKRDGTGVGLAVAQQVIAAHGGTIEVESEPGRGTRMIIHLPQHGGANG